MLARGGVPAEVGDDAWVRALLEVEAALARAEAKAGVIPDSAAKEIALACSSLHPDIAKLSAAAAASGNPVVALVELLRAAVPSETAPLVHHGATSQDILDTAGMLLARRALAPLLADLRGAADAAAALAERHRDTPMAGRTLLRQAVPTTFGLKAAGWAVGLDEATARLETVRAHRLAVQFGGAAGTLAGLGGTTAPPQPPTGQAGVPTPRGLDVTQHLADALGLAEPVLPWHTIRTRIAELAAGLAEAAGVVGKAARDVTLLAQDEVAEVGEGAPGGSSAMPHKRNPVAAVSALAGAAQAPGLVATLLRAMEHEHERAAGAWHAEWRPMRELLVATGSAAAWLRDCLEHLVVHPETMRSNLDRLLAALGTAEPDLGAAPALVDRVLAGRRPAA